MEEHVDDPKAAHVDAEPAPTPAASPLPTADAKGKNWVRRHLGALFTSGLVAGLVSFATWAFAVRPIVVIESEATFSQHDPHGTVVVVRNAGQLGVASVRSVCLIREMTFEAGKEVDSWGIPARKENTFEVASLGGGERIHIPFPEYFGLHRRARHASMLADKSKHMIEIEFWMSWIQRNDSFASAPMPAAW